MSEWRIFDGEGAAWDSALLGLPGHNFYQCYAWGEVKRRLGWEVCRLIHKNACAQVLIRGYPLGLALAWIPGGVAGDSGAWTDSLGSAIRKYTGANMLYLRLNGLQSGDAALHPRLVQAGWRRPKARLEKGLSLWCDLSIDESQRLMRASANWRHNLKRSGNRNLRVSEWTDPDIASIGRIYRALEGHKGLAPQVTDAALAAYVALLRQQMILMRCDNRDGQAIALRAAVLFGDTAWDFLAAATPEARKVYASHATLWALQRACAARSVSRYDMGGADPEGNKGVFDFKRGVGAELLEYVGEWEQASNPLVRIAANAAIHRRGALA